MNWIRVGAKTKKNIVHTKINKNIVSGNDHVKKYPQPKWFSWKEWNWSFESRTNEKKNARTIGLLALKYITAFKKCKNIEWKRD